MDAGTAVVLVSASVFLSPAAIVGIVLRHRERMAALKNRLDGAPAVIAELQNLRREMADLRETTTRFDMSFDAALNRVEQRLEDVEQQPRYPSAYGATVEEEVVLRR